MRSGKLFVPLLITPSIITTPHAVPRPRLEVSVGFIEFVTVYTMSLRFINAVSSEWASGLILVADV